jgi:hypothetical protein
MTNMSGIGASLSSGAKFIVPDGEDKVNIGLSYRPARPHRLAAGVSARFNYISPSRELRIRLQVTSVVLTKFPNLFYYLPDTIMRPPPTSHPRNIPLHPLYLPFHFPQKPLMHTHTPPLRPLIYFVGLLVALCHSSCLLNICTVPTPLQLSFIIHHSSQTNHPVSIRFPHKDFSGRPAILKSPEVVLVVSLVRLLIYLYNFNWLTQIQILHCLMHFSIRYLIWLPISLGSLRTLIYLYGTSRILI